MIRSYLSDITNYHKIQNEWKIQLINGHKAQGECKNQLIIAIKFISSKYSNETCTIDIKIK